MGRTETDGRERQTQRDTEVQRPAQIRGAGERRAQTQEAVVHLRDSVTGTSHAFGLLFCVLSEVTLVAQAGPRAQEVPP